MIRKVLGQIKRKLFPPAPADPRRQSMAIPSELWKTRPNDRLIELVLKAVPVAQKVDHQDIANRMIEFPHWPQMWPGEHYKLLSALVSVLKPGVVVEIGTGSGYSSLAMKKYLPADAKLFTFDIRPWREVRTNVLTQEDFSDGRLTQVIADLGDPEVFKQHAGLLREASLVFIDAPEDEHRFIKNFGTLKFNSNPIFVFDNIRLMHLIDVWENIGRPKLDATTFGHWAGTGLVDWTA